jgi:hypothetical protein
MTVDRVPLRPDTSVQLLTDGELSMMECITRGQLPNAQGAELLLLGRVWQRWEAELRRRKREVQELERLFGS